MDGKFKGRGASGNPAPRFLHETIQQVDDGWYRDELADSIATQVSPDVARSIISRNDSPDIPFEQSINPYRGCEHGCIYCYARPSHAYLDLSPGLDFETRLFYKADAARLLCSELGRPGYVCKPITLGANTDPYQPIEQRLGVTRSILEVFERTRHPVSIVTKGTLILRDLPLLRSLAADDLVQVHVSVTTLDATLKRSLEPRAASAQARLRVIAQLRAAGVPTGVLVAPIIPAINDAELEQIIAAVAAAGAQQAGYVLLRLPHELAAMFRQWLAEHYPARAGHVMALVRETHAGRDNDPHFGSRMRGSGPWAQLLRDRFALACRQHGLPRQRPRPLQRTLFQPPRLDGQLSLGL